MKARNIGWVHFKVFACGAVLAIALFSIPTVRGQGNKDTLTPEALLGRHLASIEKVEVRNRLKSITAVERA